MNWRRVLHGLYVSGRAVLPRAYAAGLMLLICYVTFRAVRYLILGLTTTGAPAKIVELPRRLDRDLLGTERSAWRALGGTMNTRSPLAHYHRLDGWIAPDHFNDCARSGCHAPLPHSKRKEVRAFLNMHATSIHCGVCHMKTDERPLGLTWYDLETGQSTSPPAVLEAYRLLQSREAPTVEDAAAKAMQSQLVDLLRRADQSAGGVPALRELAGHFAAARAGSDVFAMIWTQARDVLPRHFRGEYGAKLALRQPGNGEPVLGHPNTEGAVREYLRRGDKADTAERKQLLEAVHPRKRDSALHCTDCHTTKDGLVDFSKAGYPPGRIEALTSPTIARMIEHINSGQSMNLPRVRPGPAITSQPAGL